MIRADGVDGNAELAELDRVRARQPDESGSITRNQLVALAMVESTAIFCLVIGLILLFANPLMPSGG